MKTPIRIKNAIRAIVIIALLSAFVGAGLRLAAVRATSGARSATFATPVFINEIHYDNAGTDAGEAIEIAGPAGTNLAGWSLVLYNGGNGAVYDTENLSGVIPNQQNGFGVLSFPADGIQNGAPDGVALVNASNVVAQFLSYEGTFTAVGGPANGMTSVDIGVSENGSEPAGQSLRLSETGANYEDFTWNGPAASSFGSINAGQTFVAPGAQPITPTCPASLATSAGTAASGAVSATDPDSIVNGAMITSVTPDNPRTLTLGGFTPATADGGVARASLDVGATTPAGVYFVTITWSNNESQTATCLVTVTVISATPTLIHDIQGNAETPNFVGQVKLIEGIVVGDFQGASNLSGFFVQEEDADTDADPATSEGIFVFEGSSSTPVNVGDKVRVTGMVTNFGGPPGLTELINPTVTVLSSGNPLPKAATPALPVTNSPAADLERFEGMRVTFNQTLFVTENENLGRFGELTLSANSPLYIPTNSIDPNDSPASGNSTSGNSNVAAVTAQQTINNNNRIVLNDGKTGANPNPIPFIGVGVGATVRRGDSVANLSGVLSFGFNNYRIEPTSTVTFNALNPRSASPGLVGGALRVASFNVENYFLTTNADPNYRGPNNAAELTRKRDKVVAALAGLNADVIGLIELEKATTSGGAAADLAAALTTAMGGGANTYAAISDPATLVGTDPDIKNGIIYRASAVTPVGGVLNDTAAAAGAYSRDPIAQTFQKNGAGDKFTIVVNHFRSKGCGGASGADADQGDGQACFNTRRRSQAQALLTFINSKLIPIDPDVLVVGDLNAYGQEDPIDVFRAAGYNDALDRFVAAPSQYSFTFNGEAGRLDHAFATASLSAQIAGATIWQINSDEPDVFDYNTEFKPDDRYAPTPFRSADHDPILIGLSLFTPITISGQAFNDVNRDGVKNAGETGLQGVTIQLDQGADGTAEETATTDAGGNYSFSNLGTGAYRVRQAPPSGYVQTTANPPDIIAVSGENVRGVDFGNFNCAAVNCQPTGPGEGPRKDSLISGQWPGSILIYNIYASGAASPDDQDTRINITNVEPSRVAYVRLFFVDGDSCSVADSLICLTPNQTVSFLTSDVDPGATGYVVAVAVDQRGCPANFNFLIGDERMKFSSGHAANLVAEAISALAGVTPRCDGNSATARLDFDGVSYDPLPRVLALSNIPSRADGNDTMLILNRIGGDLTASAATLTNVFGTLYDDTENGLSFSFSPGSCQLRSSVANSLLRIAPRFEQFVPSGRSGWMKLYSIDDQAILGAAINFNRNAGGLPGAFNQGHNLSKMTLTTSASYTIPIFPPSC
jgi:predicted extracellular nuclease